LVNFEHFAVSAGSTSASLLIECFEFSQVRQVNLAAATELAHSPARTPCEQTGEGRESHDQAGIEDASGVVRAHAVVEVGRESELIPTREVRASERQVTVSISTVSPTSRCRWRMPPA
jgi:hypothetical protein